MATKRNVPDATDSHTAENALLIPSWSFLFVVRKNSDVNTPNGVIDEKNPDKRERYLNVSFARSTWEPKAKDSRNLCKPMEKKKPQDIFSIEPMARPVRNA